jgi:hypothetical protein
MIWGTIPNEECLALWKKLREDLEKEPLDKRLSEVAKFCSRMPFGSRTLDYYTPKEWPTPWEILCNGSFCTSSISLMMYYTIILLPDSPNIELLLVEDEDGIYLLPLVDNHYVLNYELGQISTYSDIEKLIKVLGRYTRDQIKQIT